jgi:hypothetical protein
MGAPADQPLCCQHASNPRAPDSRSRCSSTMGEDIRGNRVALTNPERLQS